MRSVQVYEGEHSFRLLDAKQKIKGIYSFRNRTDTDHHQHSCHELHVCTKGCTRFVLDFHETVDLNQGEWILLGNVDNTASGRQEYLENIFNGILFS